MDTEVMDAEATAFRPIKRRKFTRNIRASETNDSQIRRLDIDSPDDDGLDAIDIPISDILRLRKTKTRRNGIEFSNTRPRNSESPLPSTSTDITLIDPDTQRMKAISDRFVAHSGQVVDVDRHMFVLPGPSPPLQPSNAHPAKRQRLTGKGLTT